jgi:integrase
MARKGFPLFKHSKGWAKKIKDQSTGKWKTFYFGQDKDAAAKRWNAEKDALYAGVTPKTRSGKPTLKELANVYLFAMREQQRITGKPGLRHIDLLEYTIRRLMGFLSEDYVAEDLSPHDFAKIKLFLFEPIKRTKATRGKVYGRRVKQRCAETVAGDVRRIKAFLNWCHKAEHIPAPRYGGMFAAETEVAHTKQSIRKVRKDLRAKDITKMIDAARLAFKPVLWLGINAGLGNRDIAGMELQDFNGKWMDLPRLKTGGDRRFELWPETRTAIEEYLENRPRAKKGHEHILFLTSHGHAWMRGEGHMDLVDSIGTTFTKLRKDCGIDRGSFYDLRRTFATIASECLDTEAVRRVMGHVTAKSNMLGRTYVQHISDERLKAVSDHVRAWLLGE